MALYGIGERVSEHLLHRKVFELDIPTPYHDLNEEILDVYVLFCLRINYLLFLTMWLSCLLGIAWFLLFTLGNLWGRPTTTFGALRHGRWKARSWLNSLYFFYIIATAPLPIININPVCNLQYSCVAYDASKYHFSRLRSSVGRKRGNYMLPCIYLGCCLSLPQLKILGIFTLVDRKVLVNCMFRLTLF